MFKILSDDEICRAVCGCTDCLPEDRPCIDMDTYQNVAQAQMEEDARGIVDFLEGQCQNLDHCLVGYGRCDCHECIDDILRALTKLAQVAD